LHAGPERDILFSEEDSFRLGVHFGGRFLISTSSNTPVHPASAG
jgi:hypothetical protein